MNTNSHKLMTPLNSETKSYLLEIITILKPPRN